MDPMKNVSSIVGQDTVVFFTHQNSTAVSTAAAHTRSFRQLTKKINNRNSGLVNDVAKILVPLFIHYMQLKIISGGMTETGWGTACISHVG
jgi:hypothetical protein